MKYAKAVWYFWCKVCSSIIIGLLIMVALLFLDERESKMFYNSMRALRRKLKGAKNGNK